MGLFDARNVDADIRRSEATVGGTGALRQVIQSYRTGRLELAKVPLPALKSGQVMVQATFSAVSLGTEGQKVSTARQSMLGKARARPDLVRQVIDSARQDGLLSTCRRVMARLDEP